METIFVWYDWFLHYFTQKNASFIHRTFSQHCHSTNTSIYSALYDWLMLILRDVREWHKSDRTHIHTSYLSPQSPIYRWRKIGHVEKFQISIHNICGEIRNFARFGGISKFYTWHMWRNLKFILFLVVKSVLWQFMLFLLKLFCCDLRAFVWKEIEPKIV